MAVLEIVQIGSPVLRERARELTPEELPSNEVQGFIDDLIATMRHAHGAGLAANQVARLWRVCAIEVKDNPRYPYKPNVPLTVLINPEVEKLGEATFDNYEGCLSVPNLRGVVQRHCRVRVRGLLRDGRAYDDVIEGLTAGTFQHELDHLDGVLFVDRVSDPRTLSTWEAYRQHHEAAFVERAKVLVARYGS